MKTRFSVVIPFLFSIFAFLMCIAIVFYAYPLFLAPNHVALFLALLLIPLVFCLTYIYNFACFYLIALSLGARPIAYRFTKKPHFSVPSELAKSKKFWISLQMGRIWPPLVLLIFSILFLFTLSEFSYWRLLFEFFGVFASRKLFSELFPLSPHAHPSAAKVLKLIQSDDDTIQYLAAIYEIKADLAQNLSYIKMDPSIFLPEADLLNVTNVTISSINPLKSQLYYHSIQRIFAQQDYKKYLLVGDAFIKSNISKSKKEKNLVMSNLLFSELVTFNRPGKLKILFTDSLKRHLLKKSNKPYIMRTRYAYDLIALNDWTDAERIKERWDQKNRFTQKHSYAQEEDNCFELALFQAKTR